jgi:hypothetical protein
MYSSMYSSMYLFIKIMPVDASIHAIIKARVAKEVEQYDIEDADSCVQHKVEQNTQ